MCSDDRIFEIEKLASPRCRSRRSERRDSNDGEQIKVGAVPNHDKKWFMLFISPIGD